MGRELRGKDDPIGAGRWSSEYYIVSLQDYPFIALKSALCLILSDGPYFEVQPQFATP